MLLKAEAHARDDGAKVWFAWRPVYAEASAEPVRFGGLVWLEQVIAIPWDCWGAGGWRYKRFPAPREA